MIPTHAIYLAGCNYRCAYCSDWPHVINPHADPVVSVQRLGDSIEAKRAAGALSVSFIGGVPDVNLAGILNVLQHVRQSVPVVWNTNLSTTPLAQDLLEGVVDCTLADLKYGNEACAQASSGVTGSLATAHRNLLRAVDFSYTVVRHLILPDHVDCCTLPALDWLATTLPGCRVNLMDQYQPMPQTRGTKWERSPTSLEFARAYSYAQTLPLDLEGPSPPLSKFTTKGRGGSPRGQAESTSVAASESFITIDKSGNVVIENLSAELTPLLAKLGGGDSEHQGRQKAALPFLDGFPDPPGSIERGSSSKIGRNANLQGHVHGRSGRPPI